MRKKLFGIGIAVALVATAFVAGSAGAATPPGLTYTGNLTAPTGAVTTFAATLANDAGAAIAGAEVTFQLADQPAVTGVTDANGVATAGAEVLKAAGNYGLRVSSGTLSTVLVFQVARPNIEIPTTIAANFGGEPSVSVGPEGNIYLTSPAKPFLAVSKDNGDTWTTPKPQPFSSSGDTSVNVDSAGYVYLTNLGGGHTLQTNAYKSKLPGSDPGFPGGWTTATGALPGVTDASGQPFLTDREWGDAWIGPSANGDSSKAVAYISYHDWAPGAVWINASTDGGKTYGPAINVIAQNPVAQAYSFCNTIPGGVKIAKAGPHAGRVYVAWLAGDPATNVATGCNYTQAETFHTVWVAYSDDAANPAGLWHVSEVYDGGFGHDASALFADLTVDDQGNPYVGFIDNLEGEWHMYVSASFDGGDTWNGKSDGSGVPFDVDTLKGTRVFPAIAAGEPGHVSVAYLRTPNDVPTLPYGKQKPGGDPNALWYLYTAQTLDLNLPDGPTWTVTQVTPTPIHKGDICVLGIACVGALGSDRSLLDFIDIDIDAAGMSHIGYTANYDPATGANQSGRDSVVANEVAGPSLR